MLTELLPKNIDRCNVDIWSQDETRVGQQGSLTRIWAKQGTRPRKVRQQQIHFNIHLRSCVSRYRRIFCINFTICKHTSNE